MAAASRQRCYTDYYCLLTTALHSAFRRTLKKQPSTAFISLLTQRYFFMNSDSNIDSAGALQPPKFGGYPMWQPLVVNVVILTTTACLQQLYTQPSVVR